MAHDGQRDGEFTAVKSVAGDVKQACVEEPTFGQKRVALRIRADAQREFYAGLLAGDIVLKIGVDGLVLEIKLACERQQKYIVLEGRELEHFPLGRFVARARKLLEDVCSAGQLSNECLYLLIADVKTAELIQREAIAGAQTQDLTMQQHVEALEFVIEVLIDQGASG
jgi:hypothetical protein